MSAAGNHGGSVERRTIDDTGFAYAQACEIAHYRRLLFISGQTPEAPDGTLAQDFDGQCRQVWANLRRRLETAGMGFEHLVKVTTFLADRHDREANRRIRIETLGAHAPALTVVIVDLYDDAWRVEIEAIAAD